ncbi:MAG: hypothetical protein JXR94_23250 [Candidatus Hydrogenedentes bacterium]|nr:hypothetical protein [Candidatus Hydrogenedentota bacterium]
MKRMAWLGILVLILAAGCGKQDGTPPLEPPEPDTAAPEEAPAPDVSMTGKTKLVFFDGEATEPSFEVSSPKFSLLDDGVWVLEQATAVIHGGKGEEAVFEAGEGRFDKTSKSAALSAGVSAVIGPKHIELADMAWSDEERTARSDHPVSIVEEHSRLKASSFLFSQPDEVLTLTQVTGVVGIGQPAAAQDAVDELQFLKPAPRVVFTEDKLDRMSGGVHVELRRAGADPIRLAAADFVFSWNQADPPEPIAIELLERVQVQSPQGDIHSDHAGLDLARNALRFTGRVEGSSDQIERFDADEVRYDLDSGDSEMINLRATGVPLQGVGPAAAAGAFSAMDIERAPVVQFVQGRVDRLHGGVSIRLTPDDAARKPLALRAAEVAFAWNEAGDRPAAIQLRSNVHVDSEEAKIASQRADLDVAKRLLVFTGNVVGSTPQIERFQADTIVYDLTGEASRMTNLRATNVRVGDGAQDGASSAYNYTAMDIERAPEVLMRQGRFERIRNGVVIHLHSDDPEQPPLDLQGQEMILAFAEDDTVTPQRVQLNGDVVVSGQDTTIESQAADLDLAGRKLTFSGDVKGDMPDIKGVRADAIVWDLVTGNSSITGFKASEWDLQEEEDPALLRVEDIGDWPALLTALQRQAAGADPSPGKRIAALLESVPRQQLAGLPVDQELDERTKGRVVKYLNELLERPDFYDEAAWAGVTLRPEAREVLKGDVSKLGKSDRLRLNRHLFDAAYPDAVAPQSAGAPGP